MWYRCTYAQSNREQYIDFLRNEIPFLDRMKRQYPRKADHLDEIIESLKGKLAQALSVEPKKPTGNPPKSNNTVTMPVGFHDRLRHTTFDVMNLSPKIQRDLEWYHHEVPLVHLSPLDKLYLNSGEDIKSLYDPMRESLKGKFGDSIQLYRAQDLKQHMQDKPLSAYTNSKQVADKFVYPGREVVTKEVPIDAIWGGSRYVSDTGERPTEFWVENSKLNS